MNGRVFVLSLLGFTTVFGAGLWYAQLYAKYEVTDGMPTVLAGGVERPVENYLGIDSVTSPLKRRGCFTVDPAEFADLPTAERPTPLSAPGWFECYDYEALTNDIEAGRAIAYLAALEERNAADRMIAVYPDGRAYEWRQLNAKYQD
ncbi:DUF6446 family protein [Abyssibius alkaniclasticus]|uniref:DUF6446 family protein n=1 Tax=Abyssibius alkaniclasticus TaxID=2881234 RepID=UPI002363FD73|nr:DUF6446 family protein [Abyssibius alkaniclasticus]UPH71116.1 DUF6446 family protein [Abyssibius alkaniclasticus]|tara:strand:+ start:8761 stop:9201 length:441 start_codon:yes stop_codon:yes gene_type:complete